MRHNLPALCALALLLAAASAQAQVSVDQRALDALQPQSGPMGAQAGAKPAKPAAKPAPRPQASGPGYSGPHPRNPQPPGAPATATAAKLAPAPPVSSVTVPPAPPPLPDLPPPIAVPTRPAEPPPPASVVADAPGEAIRMPDGLRVTFGPERADLNPSTNSALRDLARETPPPGPQPGTQAAVRNGAPAAVPVPGGPRSFTVSAFAAGTPEDPSTARRLALSRALAVRSVLIAEGVPSARIYVKALGASSPAVADGPADRVDVMVGGGTRPAQPNPSSTP
jgi:outer membrane protein OmpA-like peptidoglycan-associated protein